jgi:hypothetical protein
MNDRHKLIQRAGALGVLTLALIYFSAGTPASAQTTFTGCDTTSRNCSANCTTAYNTYVTDSIGYSTCLSGCNSSFNQCVGGLYPEPTVDLRDWCESKATGLMSSCMMDPATLGTLTPLGQAYSSCIANGGNQGGCCAMLSNARLEACAPPE